MSRSWLLALLLPGMAASACKKPPPTNTGLPYTAAPVQSLTTPIDEARQPFFSAPWPDDRRLASDGTIPTDNFPNVNGQGTLAAVMLQTGDHLVHGWGVASPAYMPFSGAIDTSSLPTDPKATNGSVFLLDIDPSSPNLGQRSYVDFNFYAAKTSFLPGNVLAVRPVPGFPLQEKTEYAVVVTTSVTDTNGHAVGPQEPFFNAINGQPSTAAEQAAATFYAPLITELKREGFPLSQVAGATVFTTQPIIDEMLTLRDYLLSLPPPTFDPGTLQFDGPVSCPCPSSTASSDLCSVCICDDGTCPTDQGGDCDDGTNCTGDTGCFPCNVPQGQGYMVFVATYTAPNMQHGTPPFLQTGGDFEYDDAGTPIPGYMEHMRVSITVPTGPMPPNGWPIMMYSHGTGGNFLSSVEECGATGPMMTQQGLAVFGIDQILTEGRSGLPPSEWNTGCFSMPIADCFIDPVNAVAGRNNLRQSALDNIFLRQLAFNVTIPAGTGPNDYDIKFDTTKLGFIGHSQGGLTGSIYTAIDPEPWGSIISGAGGLVTGTILQRQDPALLPLIEGPLFLNLPAGESLDWYHPALALIQALADAVDPLNFGAHWIKDPQGRPKNIFTTSGLDDTDTPPDLAEFLNTAAGVPELTPIAEDSMSMDLAGLTPVTAPVTGNLMSGGSTVTGTFRQFPAPEGHFPIFDNSSCRYQWSTFLQTMFASPTGVATTAAYTGTTTLDLGTCSNP